MAKRFISSSIVSGVIFLLFGVGLNPGQAQRPSVAVAGASIRFSHLTSDDGLAQNTVQAMLQDRQGFMWFGTADGLSRYDGYRFITYQNDPQNPNSLSNNDVRGMIEDKDGMIWIATHGGGADKFDPLTQTFTRYLPDPQNPNTIGGDQLFTVFQDSDGDLWFGGTPNSGITRFDPKQQTFTRFRADSANPNNPDSFQGASGWHFLQTDPQNVWVTGDGVLAKFDLASGHFTNYKAAGGDTMRWPVLHQDSTGALWVGGGNGLYRFDAGQGILTNYPATTGVNDLVEDDSGLFWVASANGLFTFDPRSGQMVRRFQHNASQLDSLSDDNVLTVYRDRSGVLWIGTSSGGLNVYDPRQAQFAYYQHDSTVSSSLTAGVVGSLYAAQHDLWIAVGGTLDDLKLSNGQITEYTPSVADSSALHITAIYQDRAGVVWVGADNFRLFTFDPKTGQFTAFPLKSQAVFNPAAPAPPTAIVSIREDADGSLWLASNQEGLYELDATRQNVHFYQPPAPPVPPNNGTANAPGSSPPPPLVHPPITALYFDHTGDIWVSTWNGISWLDPHTGTFKQFRLKTAPGPDSYVEAILDDGTGVMWMASHDGLIRFDPTAETVKYYTTADGLPSNVLVGILADQAGNLWISSKKGISKFTPATGTVRNYDASDGLQGNEFESSAFAQASDGQLFFGGANGLTGFDPSQITDNSYRPPVVLTDFQLSNRSVVPGKDSLLSAPIWATNNLTLNYNQNFISFEFAALSYAAPNKNQYRYKLEGFDDDWNPTNSSRRFVTYTDLPPGDYVFRVQATNNSGLWSDKEAALAFTIQPPWWETTWFRAGAMLLAVGLLWTGYRWRIYAIQRRNRDLETLVTERTRTLQTRTQELQAREEQLRQARDAAEIANRAKSTFLANMSHELRTPLNVILGFAQIMRRSPNTPGEAQENLHMILQSGEHLLALINQVLDFSKIEAGRMALNIADFDLHQLLDELEAMFDLRANDKQLQLFFETAPNLPRYIRTDPLKLRQTLINLIGNALKFTETGGVTLRARRQDKGDALSGTACELYFEIEDTGAGIAPAEIGSLFEAFTQTATGRQSQEGTGLGLPISRKFIQLMSGDIRVKSQPGRGAIFSFNIHCQIADALKTQNHSSRNLIVGLEDGQPRYRILIADDKWANRQVLVKLLGPLGFDLREAENGQQAVDIARSFNPQFVLMDMRMPVLNGYDATRQIKSNATQPIVVVALTASAFDEERAAVLAAGCDDFLRKPVRTETIFDSLAKYLGVRYVYANLEKPLTAVNSDQPSEISKDGLKALPSDMLRRLREGVELGDVALIDETVAEIRLRSTSLADSIARSAQRFEYEKLLTLLQEAAIR